MADTVYTPAEIAESKRKAQLAFYAARSAALRRNTTTTEDAPASSGSLASPKAPPARRPGLLGYIADRITTATGN